ncbi:nuclear transport factor 2 family protein [Actinomadura rudentiformis]|nr:nuclear transport factor 2 family protein [Actinomadura rudentiformis]
MLVEDDALPAAVSDGAGERARLFVEAFAEGWRAPADGDALADHFEPWLQPDYRFVHPFSRAVGVGATAFREAFARPLFGVLSDVQGSVESWAHRGDTVYIALRLKAEVGRRRVTVHVCDRVRLVDGRAAERFTYADVTPLLSAAVRTPRSWWRILRWRFDDARAARRSK